METVIPIMVFGSTFLLLLVWIYASRGKKGGCCGDSTDPDKKDECRPCSPKDESRENKPQI